MNNARKERADIVQIERDIKCLQCYRPLDHLEHQGDDMSDYLPLCIHSMTLIVIVYVVLASNLISPDFNTESGQIFALDYYGCRKASRRIPGV